MMAEIEAEASSWARTAKDLFAGAAGGVAQVLLGKPLLTTLGGNATVTVRIYWWIQCQQMRPIRTLG